MKTKIIPDGLLEALKRNEHVYQAARRVRMQVGRVVPPRRLEGLPGRVHFNDFMLEDTTPRGVERYRERALNVIRLIERSLDSGGRSFDDIRSWLDFGSGYGRVIRFLVQRTDPKLVYASDVIEEGVEFCASEFGVNPLHSRATLAELELGQFDYVYAISVLTHLDEENGLVMLQLLHDSLEPRGIALFTTHGRWALDNIGTYGATYEAMKADIARRVDEEGVAFVPYHHYPGESYGMTWHSADYVQSQMQRLHGDEMTLLHHEPHGLDGHQDVFVYQRAG
ncbi:MAG: class I SAM-dependent methyltransferase [Actinomycetota bacterium]